MTCPTCNKLAHSPFRQYDQYGKVLNGCVDKYHTGHLTPCSASASWHNRKEAKQIRRNVEKLFKPKDYCHEPQS